MGLGLHSCRVLDTVVSVKVSQYAGDAIKIVLYWEQELPRVLCLEWQKETLLAVS